MPWATAPSSGFKPLAKLLVHMSDLEQLENVWLDSTSKSRVRGSSPSSRSRIGADVTKPATSTVTPASAPAPPSTP